MKKLLFYTLLSAFAFAAGAQPRYEILALPVCWTVSNIDSNLVRFVLVSSEASAPMELFYLDSQGSNTTVTPDGQLRNGWCCNCTGTTTAGGRITIASVRVDRTGISVHTVGGVDSVGLDIENLPVDNTIDLGDIYIPVYDSNTGQNISVNGALFKDADWYLQNDSVPPDDINQSIYTFGNVTIGQTSGIYPLSVIDDSGIAVAWRRSGGQNAITWNDGGLPGLDPRQWIYTKDGHLSIQLHPTATTYFDSVTIFRVGTTLPTPSGIGYDPIFQVNGSIYFTGEIVDSDGFAGAAGEIIRSDGAGENHWSDVKLDTDGDILGTSGTPANTADATGETGNIFYDNDFIYIKTAAGWKRAALSTF